MKNNLKYGQKDSFSLRKLFFNLFYITLTPPPHLLKALPHNGYKKHHYFKSIHEYKLSNNKVDKNCCKTNKNTYVKKLIKQLKEKPGT